MRFYISYPDFICATGWIRFVFTLKPRGGYSIQKVFSADKSDRKITAIIMG